MLSGVPGYEWIITLVNFVVVVEHLGRVLMVVIFIYLFLSIY